MQLPVVLVTLLVFSWEGTRASRPSPGEQDSCSEGKTPPGKLKHINVILIGATGELWKDGRSLDKMYSVTIMIDT